MAQGHGSGVIRGPGPRIGGDRFTCSLIIYNVTNVNGRAGPRIGGDPWPWPIRGPGSNAALHDPWPWAVDRTGPRTATHEVWPWAVRGPGPRTMTYGRAVHPTGPRWLQGRRRRKGHNDGVSPRPEARKEAPQRRRARAKTHVRARIERSPLRPEARRKRTRGRASDPFKRAESALAGA